MLKKKNCIWVVLVMLFVLTSKRASCIDLVPYPNRVDTVTDILISNSESYTLSLPQNCLSVEIGMSFSSGTVIELIFQDSMRLLAHVSDKKVTGDLLHHFYLLELYDKTNKIVATKEYELGSINNYIAIKVSPDRLEFGNKTLESEIKHPIALSSFNEIKIKTNKSAKLKRIVTEVCPWLPPVVDYSSMSNLEYWQFFDETLDLNYALLGGIYTLAMYREGDNIILLYISGAEINSTIWTSGMVKGIAYPTVDNSVYSLKWIDAEFYTDSYRPFISFNSTDMFTITFPYDMATMRFVKIRN